MYVETVDGEFINTAGWYSTTFIKEPSHTGYYNVKIGYPGTSQVSRRELTQESLEKLKAHLKSLV